MPRWNEIITADKAESSGGHPDLSQWSHPSDVSHLNVEREMKHSNRGQERIQEWSLSVLCCQLHSSCCFGTCTSEFVFPYHWRTAGFGRWFMYPGSQSSLGEVCRKSYYLWCQVHVKKNPQPVIRFFPSRSFPHCGLKNSAWEIGVEILFWQFMHHPITSLHVVLYYGLPKKSFNDSLLSTASSRTWYSKTPVIIIPKKPHELILFCGGSVSRAENPSSSSPLKQFFWWKDHAVPEQLMALKCQQELCWSILCT